MNKLLTGLCIFFGMAALLVGYGVESLRLKQAAEKAATATSSETASAVESPEVVQRPELPPAAARGVQEFISTAVGAGGVKVTVRSASGRVSVVPECVKPQSTAKPELYENPDGDGAAYQEDVVGYVFQAEDVPSYVLDTLSDYPSP